MNTASTTNQIYHKEYKDKMESIYKNQTHLQTVIKAEKESFTRSAQTDEVPDVGSLHISQLEGDFDEKIDLLILTIDKDNKMVT